MQRTRPQLAKSPTTGDLGFAEHPWLRMNDAVLGFNTPTVMLDVEELRGNGYDPEALGMTLLGTHRSAFEVPVMQTVADLKSRYDIDLYEPDSANQNHPTMMLGGVFIDPHPDDWWERVHRDKALVVLAGDTPLLASATPASPVDMGLLLQRAYIGRVRGLMIRAYSSGVGTQMPDA